VPVLKVEYDQETARLTGLSRKDVSMSLLTAAGGIPVATFYDGTHPRTIYIRQTEADGSPVDNLENISVFTTLPTFNDVIDEKTVVDLSQGILDKDAFIDRLMASIPLMQVTKSVDVEWEQPIVPRYNGERMVRVQASPAEGVETERARKAVAEQIEQIKLPVGYSLKWQGEKAASAQSMRYLFGNMPLAVILMIAILIMLFKDYRKPAIIMLTIPMVFVGVVVTMVLCRKTFDFVAIVGTLGLIGMIIKNGIVLMDEITRQIGEGIDQRKALVDSALSRLRPVSLAALTTILGMIPLLSDSMFGSMAAAIMGGLLFGTIITLVFIPVLYSLFFKSKNESK
jgi:multidrug efflux pump subunit AcrB